MTYLLIFALLFSGLYGSAAAAETRPNIIVIITDAMGFSDIGPYGGEIKAAAK